MDVASLINEFGPWAIVVASMGWLAVFSREQLEKAREERMDEAKRHEEEVGKLSDIIANNTVALTELTAYLKKGEE